MHNETKQIRQWYCPVCTALLKSEVNNEGRCKCTCNRCKTTQIMHINSRRSREYYIMEPRSKALL